MNEQREIFKDRGLAVDNIIWGDGLKANIMKIIPLLDQKKIKFIIKMTEELQQKFNIEPTSFPTGYVRVEYPEHLIVNLYNDPHVARNTLVMCDFLGRETEVMRLHKTLLGRLNRTLGELQISEAENRKINNDARKIKLTPNIVSDAYMERLEKVKKILPKEVPQENQGNKGWPNPRYLGE